MRFIFAPSRVELFMSHRKRCSILSQDVQLLYFYRFYVYEPSYKFLFNLFSFAIFTDPTMLSQFIGTDKQQMCVTFQQLNGLVTLSAKTSISRPIICFVSFLSIYYRAPV